MPLAKSVQSTPPRPEPPIKPSAEPSITLHASGSPPLPHLRLTQHEADLVVLVSSIQNCSAIGLSRRQVADLRASLGRYVRTQALYELYQEEHKKYLVDLAAWNKKYLKEPRHATT